MIWLGVWSDIISIDAYYIDAVIGMNFLKKAWSNK